MKEFNQLQQKYKDYGKKDFLKLLSVLLEFQLPGNLDSIIIDFIQENNTITIRNNKNIDYTLSLYEDCLVFTRNRRKYLTETIYSYKFKPFQNTVYFKGQNNTIALQETRIDNIKSRRLISYIDKQASYPRYEKEIMEFDGNNVECIYNYQDAGTQTQTYKVMSMKDCIYYYHFQTYPNNSNESYTSFLEVASATNIPKLDIFNRLYEEESIRDAISIPAPNILISGTVINKNEEPNYTYRIKIQKKSSLIIISSSEINLQDFSESRKYKTILTNNVDEITIDEIFRIIDILRYMLPAPLLPKVILELQNIQNNINIRNSNVKIGDFLDCNLKFYTDFNKLASDIFKNLSNYEQFIEFITQKQKEFNQLKLAKK